MSQEEANPTEGSDDEKSNDMREAEVGIELLRKMQAMKRGEVVEALNLDGLDEESQQDVRDAEEELHLLAKLKEGKKKKKQKQEGGSSQPARKSDSELRAEAREEHIRGLQGQPVSEIRIPRFDGKTGVKLSVEEGVQWVRDNHPEITIPNFDKNDGHKLSAQEQMDHIESGRTS